MNEQVDFQPICTYCTVDPTMPIQFVFLPFYMFIKRFTIFNKKNTMNFALGTFFYNSCCCCSVNDDIAHLNLFFKMI